MHILFSGLLLIGAAFIVFRILVKRSYANWGRLSLPISLLQLLVFAAIIGFPSLFNPSEWLLFWRINSNLYPWHQRLGTWMIVFGLVSAFGIMFWFGLRRALGLYPTTLVRQGPYRLSRNPQILGGYLMVLGVFLQWPSLPALGWVGLYGLVCHLMILAEEEHLMATFGSEYETYCREVPRYLFPRKPSGFFHWKQNKKGNRKSD